MSNQFSVEEAKKRLDALLENPKLLYVICPYNIGDFLINGGLCYALQIKKSKISCALVVCEKFKDAGIDFVGALHILYISQHEMDMIRAYILSTRIYETEQYIYGHFHYVGDRVLGTPELVLGDQEQEAPMISFIDRYRKDVFELPLETEVLPPLVSELSSEQRERLHARFQMDARTILLAPFANSSLQLFPEEVWIVLAERLQKLGYTVYTNVAGGKETAVQGTTPVRLSFPELYYAAGKVKCIIGRRSGIFDFLAFSEGTLLCVLYPEHVRYDLRRNFPGKKSYAFYHAGHYREMLLQYAQEHHIDDISRMSIPFPYVDVSEVYYEDGRLIDAVVKTVESL